MVIPLAVHNVRKAVKAQINSTGFFKRLLRLCHKLGYTGSKPVTRGGALHPHTLDSAVVMTVKAAYPADLGQFDTTALEYRTLSVFQRGLCTVFGLKPGVFSAFFKECPERKLKVTQTVLQRVTIRVKQPEIFSFEGGQLFTLLLPPQAFTCRLKNFLPSGKPPIPHVASMARLVNQRLFLLWRQAQLHLKRFGYNIHALAAPVKLSANAIVPHQHAKNYGYRHQKFLPPINERASFSVVP